MGKVAIAWLIAAIGLPALAQQPNCPANNLNPNCPNNVIELRRQQEAARQAAIQRAQQEAAQKAAQQRAQQEAAQRAAQQRAQQEAAQKAALQRQQQEAAQRAAQQEAAQKAAQQRAQQEAAQRAAQQRTQQEAAQKAALQKQQQEAAQRAATQKAQQDAAQKAAQQRAQQEAAQKAAQQRAQQEAAQKALKQPAPQIAAPKPVAPPPPTLAKPAPAQPTQAPRALPPQPAPKVAIQPAPTPQALPAQPAPKVAVQPSPVPPSRSGAPAPRPLALSPAATVVPAPNRAGYTINQRNADGSNVVVQQSVLPTGGRQVTAYRQIEDPRTRTSTRTYYDGYRVTQTPTYVSRTLPNRATYTQYGTGLRGAALPGGRTVYREQFVTERSGGVERRTVQRTVYMRPVAGNYVPMRTQVVQTYDVVTVYRRPVYVYRPVRYMPVFFAAFAAPFAAPLAYGPQCVVCPPPVAAYDAPQHYSNSYELLGDMQLAGPLVDDPLLPARDAAGYVPAAPDVANLHNEVDDLQRQLDQQARDNAELQAAISQTGSQRTSLAPGSSADASRMKVPERVREVMRKQVRLSVAQHQNGKPLLLSDIVESGFAPIYVFQASAPIDVEDVGTGAPCRLAAGDLAEFHRVPDGSAASAPMSVIASRPGHCAPNQVVQVKYEDLQDMLNAFNQRVEENMNKLNSCLTAPGGCART